jgi:antitoxin component of RelBE/YafQ-DinJ toxin-antitoxin module
MQGNYKILKIRIDTKLLERLNKASEGLNIPLSEFLTLKFFDIVEEFEEAGVMLSQNDEGNQLDS